MAKYLMKANDDVLSWCRCDASLAALPGQLDCPWCGCGWLIGCIDCRKAFTFAEVVETDLSYAEIVRKDGQNRGLPRTDDEIVEDAEQIAGMIEPLRIGVKVVYLDGCFIAIDDPLLDFTGLFARHSLNALPQVEALKNPSKLKMLEDVGYWIARERPDRE